MQQNLFWVTTPLMRGHLMMAFNDRRGCLPFKTSLEIVPVFYDHFSCKKFHCSKQVLLYFLKSGQALWQCNNCHKAWGDSTSIVTTHKCPRVLRQLSHCHKACYNIPSLNHWGLEHVWYFVQITHLFHNELNGCLSICFMCKVWSRNSGVGTIIYQLLLLCNSGCRCNRWPVTDLCVAVDEHSIFGTGQHF